MDTNISIQELQEQIAWEEKCSNEGIERYVNKQKMLTEQNKGELTDVTQVLLKDRVIEFGKLLEETITEKLRKAAREKYSRLVQLSAINYVDGESVYDYNKVALVAIKIIMKELYRKDRPASRAAVISKLGVTLETDLKCLLFKNQFPMYYRKIEQSLSDRDAMTYVQKLRIIHKKFKDFEMDWHEWTIRQRTGVGLIVFEHAMLVLDDVLCVCMRRYGAGKPQKYVETRDSFMKWASMVEVEKAKLHGTPMPLLIQPRDWIAEDLESGVYYTMEAANKVQLIKKKFGWGRDWIRQHPPHEHIAAFNTLQHTPWKINMQVLRIQNKMFRENLGGLPSRREDLITDFPEELNKPKEEYTEEDKVKFVEWRKSMTDFYTEERKRKGQTLAYTHIHKMALDLRDREKFFFGWNADFRGRGYCLTPALSPQGCDTGRGLLSFASEEEVTEDGLDWLALSMTSKFGADSQSIENRIKWVHDREDMIREFVKHPIDTRDQWLQADKPFQFIASCYEWAKTDFGKNDKALVSLPVGIDGKCNGLQHYSALLRDEYGAKATNLTPCVDPEDIYGEVALVTTRKLQLSKEQLAKEWLAIIVTRKCTKKPVMTLPYGATQHSARSYIKEFITDNLHLLAANDIPQSKEHISELTNFLTPIVWASIKEVVRSAIVGMAWIQRNGKKVVKRDGHLKVLTPAGFPMYQAYMTDKRTEIRSEILGSVSVYINKSTDVPSLVKHNNGISPNLIHSLDSTHMIRIINSTHKITETNLFSMIHDEYGTHPKYMTVMSKVVRDEFYNLYKNDVLADWKEQLGIDEPLPEYGTLDISEVLNAMNAFI